MLERKGLRPEKFAEEFGISRSTVFNWLASDEPPPPKHWESLVSFFGVSRGFLLTGNPEKQDTGGTIVGEEPGPYFPRNTGPEIGKQRGSSPVQINPAFAPPAPHPTSQDCLNHLAAYLAEAEHVPGLVAHTLIELKKNFKIAEARAQRED